MERFDVLRLEDDEAWAALVKTWLGHKRFTVKHVGSREEMRAHFSKDGAVPRCLILDLAVGDSKGFSLCDEVKRSPALQGIPLVILTGSNVSTTECLEHGALYRVRKDESAGAELAAVLETVLVQHERSQGLIDAGDLRLDPRSGQVYRDGKLAAQLTPGHFAGFVALVKSSPEPVADPKLYESFLARQPYHKNDQELTSRLIVRNYVSNLRRDLGSLIGGRIQRDDQGYAYRPVKPLPRI